MPQCGGSIDLASVAVIAYDIDLAARVRALLGLERGMAEKSMFGGLAFLINGNLAVAASGDGGILVRVDPDDTERLLRTTKAAPMVMRGRPMRGWLRVSDDAVRTKRQLQPWVDRGASYARSLPKK